MNFSQDVQRLQRSYYCGKIERQTTIDMMDALMHEYKMLDENEHLVDIPDDFGKFFEQTGFLGEFTVRADNSSFTWKRSYADRPNPQKVTLFTDPPPYSLAPSPASCGSGRAGRPRSCAHPTLRSYRHRAGSSSRAAASAGALALTPPAELAWNRNRTERDTKRARFA